MDWSHSQDSCLILLFRFFSAGTFIIAKVLAELGNKVLGL